MALFHSPARTAAEPTETTNVAPKDLLRGAGGEVNKTCEPQPR